MQTALNRLMERSDVAQAVASVVATDDDTLTSQVELSEIPAPAFKEEARGTRMAELMSAARLLDVRRDAVGNVLGDRAGLEGHSPFVISAHLDTVFPAGTAVTVTRDGDLLRGPGISDDARGLASLLALARALHASGIRTRLPLRFVATVGEEGIGDLRGVKYLFGSGGEARDAAAFISLDGAGLERIVVNGLGARRLRVTMTGPGGHSWNDWGTSNPIHALADIARRISEVALPGEPRTTLTIARWGGGTSINAIPQEAWIEIDMRSAAEEKLQAVESQVRACISEGAARHDRLDADVTVIGSRPGGATHADGPLVQAALAATRSQKREPVLATSSTDSNIPMSCGIPAITIGCGGEAGQAHTTDEWYRNVLGPEGIVRALYTVLLIAGVED